MGRDQMLLCAFQQRIGGDYMYYDSGSFSGSLCFFMFYYFSRLLQPGSIGTKQSQSFVWVAALIAGNGKAAEIEGSC